MTKKGLVSMIATQPTVQTGSLGLALLAAAQKASV